MWLLGWQRRALQEDLRCGSPGLPEAVPIHEQRPAKAKHLGIVQVNVTSWGPLLSSTSMLSTFHLAFVQEHRARGARLDEVRLHFQKAGWRGFWSQAASGKQGASKGGVAILSRPCLRVDEHLELYGGRLVTARVHVRKLGWVQTYCVYGEAGQQWTEVNTELMYTLRRHIRSLGGGLWFAAGDWNLLPQQVFEKMVELELPVHVQAPASATCVTIGSSSTLDYMICHPELASMLSSTDVEHGFPVQPHYAVSHMLARCLPGHHVKVLLRSRPASAKPVFGPHLLPPCQQCAA